jgi:CheY-like chemotaxis protein
VDDDQDIREAMSEVLSEQGHQVVTASNGAEALDLLGRPPLPCLVLLDLMMPVMNGRKFLEERQRDPTLAAIPVVVLTAGRAVELHHLEGLPIVKKPFELQLLRSLVEEYCPAGVDRQTDTLRPPAPPPRAGP